MAKEAIFNQIFSEEERKLLIKRNKTSIKRALRSVDKDLLKMNEKLIDEAAQYGAALTEINEMISRDGFVESYKNGENQWGTKKSVAAELKPKYTQIYQSLIKQLTELLPSETEKNAAAELMEFVNRRK